MTKRKLLILICLFVTLVSSNVNAQEETVDETHTSPVVYAEPQFETHVTTHIYAQGLTHEDWGSKSAEVMDLQLDVYEPIDAPGNRPAMIIIHGGAFRLGSRDDGRFVRMAEYFASRGWVTISIDYRLVGDYGTIPQEWQDGIQQFVDPSNQETTLAVYAASRDSKAAVRWLHANADTYQINTDHVTALGMSAGASLAIMLGTTNADIYRDELTLEDDPTLASTNLGQPADVHTIIALSMTPAANTLIETVYGIDTYDETDAPIMIMNGTEDRLVDISEAEMLRDQYEAIGVPYAYYPVEGAGHTLQFMNAEVDGMPPMELAFTFVVEQQGLVIGD